jgi:hypothetical protein
VDKPTLLQALHERFGLRYHATQSGNTATVNATGNKPHYYSLNRKAEALGYVPAYSSLAGVLEEATALIG